MAEGLFRHATRGSGGYRVMSAGLGAMEGQPPSAHAVQALKELGIDISSIRSRMLSPELVNQADYIFGMTHSHIDTINLLFPQAAEKTFLLREFDETLDIFEKDISDPIGGSYEVYVNCRDQIEQGIASLLGFLGQTETSRITKAVAAGKTATVALGAGSFVKVSPDCSAAGSVTTVVMTITRRVSRILIVVIAVPPSPAAG